jgi:hypothetical protein
MGRDIKPDGQGGHWNDSQVSTSNLEQAMAEQGLFKFFSDMALQ